MNGKSGYATLIWCALTAALLNVHASQAQSNQSASHSPSSTLAEVNHPLAPLSNLVDTQTKDQERPDGYTYYFKGQYDTALKTWKNGNWYRYTTPTAKIRFLEHRNQYRCERDFDYCMGHPFRQPNMPMMNESAQGTYDRCFEEYQNCKMYQPRVVFHFDSERVDMKRLASPQAMKSTH